MTRKCVVFAAVVLACGSMFAIPASPVAAQEGQRPGTPILAPSPTAGAPSERTNVTLTGCLYAESQIPGRKADVAEGAPRGDFFLVSDRGKSPAAPAATRDGVGTSAAMYKVEHMSDDRWKALVGKHVEITGHVTWGKTIAGDVPAKAGAADDTLAKIDARSMREVPGTCPATPSVPR